MLRPSRQIAGKQTSPRLITCIDYLGLAWPGTLKCNSALSQLPTIVPAMAPQILDVEAILFDMDGTLVDSTAAVTKTYLDFCKAHGIEVTGHPHVRCVLCTGRGSLADFSSTLIRASEPAILCRSISRPPQMCVLPLFKLVSLLAIIDTFITARDRRTYTKIRK